MIIKNFSSFNFIITIEVYFKYWFMDFFIEITSIIISNLKSHHLYNYHFINNCYFLTNFIIVETFL